MEILTEGDSRQVRPARSNRVTSCQGGQGKSVPFCRLQLRTKAQARLKASLIEAILAQAKQPLPRFIKASSRPLAWPCFLPSSHSPAPNPPRLHRSAFVDKVRVAVVVGTLASHVSDHPWPVPSLPAARSRSIHRPNTSESFDQKQLMPFPWCSPGSSLAPAWFFSRCVSRMVSMATQSLRFCGAKPLKDLTVLTSNGRKLDTKHPLLVQLVWTQALRCMAQDQNLAPPPWCYG